MRISQPLNLLTNTMSIILGLIAAFLATNSATAESFIVKDGKPEAQIVIAEKPTRMQKLAAEELQKYVKKITGAELKITSIPTDETPVKIYVGKSKYTDKLKLDNKNLEHGAYEIKSGKDYLVLLGKDTNYYRDSPNDGGVYPANHGDRKRAAEEWKKRHGEKWSSPFVSSFKSYNKTLAIWEADEHGSLNAVNDFLHSLGVRWFMPGDFGEVCPKMASIHLPKIDKTVHPEFATRIMNFGLNVPFMASPDELLWRLRLGLNPIGEIKVHGIAYMLRPGKVKKEHPEFYAIFDGKRDTMSRGGKPCCSSKGLFDSSIEFAKLMYDKYNKDCVSLMPTDGYSRFCECELCVGKDTPNRNRAGIMSDYVWDFINRAGEEIAKTHPNKKVSCFAYTSYLLPPDKIEKLNPNVVIGICQHRCDFHDPEIHKKYLNSRDEWLKKLSNKKINIFEYYLHANPGRIWDGIPAYFPRLIDQDIKLLKGKVNGESIQVARSFSSLGSDKPDPALAVNHLNCYVTSQMWWDPDLDIDALLDDYYQKFYGPAANEMKAFIEHCEKTWPVMPQNSKAIVKALKLLDLAGKAAGENNIHAKRVKWVVDYVKAPLTQLNNRLTTKRADVPYTRISPSYKKTEFKLDGKLDDEFWGALPYYCSRGSLSECQTGRTPYLGTSFLVTWDNDALYFGIRCNESDTTKLNLPTDKNDDPAIFEGDFVSLLLESQCHAYYEIAVSPNGAMIDIDRKDGENIKWSSYAEVATYVGEGFWTVEIRIPVLAETQVSVDPDRNGVAGRKPNPTYPWFFNICRQRKREKETELSARYPTGKPTARDAYYFGKIRPRR